jgi:uncharacterized membrane protein YeiH
MASNVVLAIDLLGSFAFAISGATVGVRRGLDLFGVLVLSFAAATAGGIARDALIGATPPAALVDWRYLAVAAAAGILSFYRDAMVERLRNPVQLFDAIGLGLFAVNGAAKASAHGVGPTGAVLLGILTGVGGGVARDLLVAEVPAVLRRVELYATAAALGAGIVVIGEALALPPTPLAITGAFACFLLRFLALRHGWTLPVPRHGPRE